MEIKVRRIYHWNVAMDEKKVLPLMVQVFCYLVFSHCCNTKICVPVLRLTWNSWLGLTF